MAAVKNKRSFTIITTLIFILVQLAQAWTTNPVAGSKINISYRSCSRELTLLKAREDSALHYQYGNYEQELTSLDTESRLEHALQAARDADRRYGLCTPASTRAWKIVDDIYSLSSASQQVEDSVKKVLGGEANVWSMYDRKFANV